MNGQPCWSRPFDATIQFEEVVDDFHKTREGRNGGGDPWHTDAKLYVGVTVRESP
jgi:hypothetical protein